MVDNIFLHVENNDSLLTRIDGNTQMAHFNGLHGIVLLVVRCWSLELNIGYFREVVYARYN